MVFYWIGFLNNCRSWKSRLVQRLNPFIQYVKATENKDKIISTPELINDLREIIDVLDKCCQTALRQPLPDEEMMLKTEAGFRAAAYAVLTDDDPNQKIRSTRET